MGLVKNRENYQVAISLNGMWTFSKQGETKLLMQNSLTGEHKQILNARLDSRRKSIRHVEMAAKSINGKWLILIFRDNTFTEWYLPQKDVNLKKNDINSAPLIRAVSSNNHWALREINSGHFEVQDLFTGKIVHVIQKKDDNFGLEVGLGSEDNEFWRKIVIYNDGCFVLMPTPNDGDLVLWDLKNYPKCDWFLKAYQRELRPSANISTIILSADEQFCIVGFYNGVINIYELKSDRKVYSCQEHKIPITCVAMSPDNQILISGTNNGIITVCNFQSQAAIDLKLDTVVKLQLDTEVSYCSFHSEQPFVIVGDIQEKINIFEQVLSKHSFDDKASQDKGSSTNVVSDQPTIISKRIRMQALCGEERYFIKGDFIKGEVIGPGNLQIELYNQNHLIYQYNEFIPKGKARTLSTYILFPNEPWEEDLKGYIALQTPNNKFICRVDLTISCLITKRDVLRWYRYVVGNYPLDELLKLNERLFGPFHRKIEETIDLIIEYNKTQYQQFNQTKYKDSEVELLEAKKQQIQNSWSTEIVTIQDSGDQKKIVRYNGSSIRLFLRPEDIIELDSQDSTYSGVKNNNYNQAIDYKDSLGSELEDVWFLLKTLVEPGIDRFVYLGKAWKKLKLIVSMALVDKKTQLLKFLTNLREASISSQLMLVFQNKKKLLYFTIFKIFSSFLITIFIISTITHFFISNVSNLLGENQIISNSLLLFWAICLIASYLILIVILIPLGDLNTPNEEDFKKAWYNLILAKLIFFFVDFTILFIGHYCRWNSGNIIRNKSNRCYCRRCHRNHSRCHRKYSIN